MLFNFILALSLLVALLAGLLSLQASIHRVEMLFRAFLRWSRRSRILTEYLLRAYLRYKKNLAKPALTL